MIHLCLYLILITPVLIGCSSASRTAGPNTIANLAPFVQLNGITYLAVNSGEAHALRADALDEEFAHIRSMLADSDVDFLTYDVKDGDSAYLPAGTPIFALKDYDPRFRLAAWQDSQLILFEADTNPTAQRGRDLLDLDGKVDSITITATNGTTELATITDPFQRTHLVNLLLSAPVDQQAQNDEHDERYFLVFHLNDGTMVNRAFWPQSGEVARGIMLPKEFSEAVQRAIHERS